MVTHQSLPLFGLRVLECTHAVMGPTADLILADLGADTDALLAELGYSTDDIHKLKAIGHIA